MTGAVTVPSAAAAGRRAPGPAQPAGQGHHVFAALAAAAARPGGGQPRPQLRRGCVLGPLARAPPCAFNLKFKFKV